MIRCVPLCVACPRRALGSSIVLDGVCGEVVGRISFLLAFAMAILQDSCRKQGIDYIDYTD